MDSKHNSQCRTPNILGRGEKEILQEKSYYHTYRTLVAVASQQHVGGLGPSSVQ